MAMAQDQARSGPPDQRYKWIALSNITLGTLMVFINQSIVLIALPAIFRGIRPQPPHPVQHRVHAVDAHGIHGRPGGPVGDARARG